MLTDYSKEKVSLMFNFFGKDLKKLLTVWNKKWSPL